MTVTVRHRLLGICIAIIYLAGVNAFALPNELLGSHLNQTIDSIDKYLLDKEIYDNRKIAVINQRRKLLADARDRYDSLSTSLELAADYRRFDVDSAAAFYYRALDMARNIGDSEKIIQAKLGLCEINPFRGIIRESLDLFEAVDPKQLSKEDLIKYYDAGFNLYLTTSTLYPADSLKHSYLNKALAYSDSLFRYLPLNSPHSYYHNGWSALGKGDYTTALTEMRLALDNTKFGDELYARIAATIADYYSDYAGDEEAAAYYLALSALSDIYAGTRETTSLQRLAIYLYKKGDISRAYRYLSVALDNSIDSGSKIRTLTEVDSLPIISKAYQEHDESQILWLYILVAFLFISVIALIIALRSHLKSNRRLSDYKMRLTQNSTLKDEYIKQILAICSNYIEKIEEQNLLIIRKIKAGQAQDLCRMAESGDIQKEQSEHFMKSFDDAFLSVYPDFVAELNKLLDPQNRFDSNSYKKLTPELRIAAFMKLGVDDSSKIASFLGLSLNTVYTYRNKLRNRAIDRENFEKNILKLCEIS